MRSLKFYTTLGYNSWYEIIDPLKFMTEIKNGFSEVAKLRHKGALSTNIKLIHGSVFYGSRENQVFEDEFDLIINLLFTKAQVSEKDKTVSYEENNEYRFAWLFKETITDKIMEVEESPILIRNTNSLKATLQ